METFKTPKGTELPLLDLKGKKYLQVPHRIMWSREDHPDWIFEVTFPQVTDKSVLARAEIRDAEGKVKACAHKMEHFAHFQDAFEKAETGAIGRALGMLGYGTQFAIELYEDENQDADAPKKVVDSPLPSKPASLSEPQVKRFWAMAKAAGASNEMALKLIKDKSGQDKIELVTKEEYNIICGYLDQMIKSKKGS